MGGLVGAEQTAERLAHAAFDRVVESERLERAHVFIWLGANQRVTATMRGGEDRGRLWAAMSASTRPRPSPSDTAPTPLASRPTPQKVEHSSTLPDIGTQPMTVWPKLTLSQSNWH